MLIAITQRAGRDDGVTLIELMVVVMVGSILGAAALAMFLSLNRAANTTVAVNLSSASSRVALDSWSALLQSIALPQDSHSDPHNAYSNPNVNGVAAGQAIASMTPTSITFYASQGNRVGASPATAARLIRLEWRPPGAAQCPAEAAPGCLIESVLDPTSTPPPVVSARVLLSHVQPGANVAAGASSDTGSCTASAISVITTRLFTACSLTGAPLSAACSPTPCTSTAEDGAVTTTTNDNLSRAANGAGALNTAVPATIVTAFTVTDADADGALHQQAYVAAAALTGQLVRS